MSTPSPGTAPELRLTSSETVNVLLALASYQADRTPAQLQDPRHKWAHDNVESAIRKLEAYHQELNQE